MINLHRFKCLAWLIGFVLNAGTFGNDHLYAVIVPRLSAVVVQVNDENQREIKRGEVLELIRGDRLRLLYATLDKSARSPDLVNFVGFWRKDLRARRGDDRDLSIDTSQLNQEWSLDKKGREYRIEVQSGNANHGEIRVRLVDPVLRSLDLLVNNEIRSLVPGESLQLKAADQIKVQAIRTNHSRLDQGARVQFREEPLADGSKKVEMQLMHQNNIFARVYLFVKP